MAQPYQDKTIHGAVELLQHNGFDALAEAVTVLLNPAVGASHSARIYINSQMSVRNRLTCSVGGTQNLIQGEKFGHGFFAAGVTQAFAGPISKIDPENVGTSFRRTLAAAALGGSVSAATGGKFANGAITGAFSRALNDELRESSLFRNSDEDPSMLTEDLLDRRLDLLRDEVARYRDQIDAMTVGEFLEHVNSRGTDTLFAESAQDGMLRTLDSLHTSLSMRNYGRMADTTLEIADQIAISRGSAILMKKLGLTSGAFELVAPGAPTSRAMHARQPTMRCTDVAVCGVIWK